MTCLLRPRIAGSLLLAKDEANLVLGERRGNAFVGWRGLNTSVTSGLVFDSHLRELLIRPMKLHRNTESAFQ